nr:DNA-directed DNA polymerase [Tanacetum cinerariifolium]
MTREDLYFEAFLNDDPSLPPPNQENYLPEVRKELKICEAKSDKSSIDEPLEVELKDLPPHLEYAFLEGDNKLPVIIAKDLSVEEKNALITDFKPAVQHQRRVNPKIHDVIKQEVLKLLDAGLICPISDSPWVSPLHCVPKKGGFTVVENEDNELIPTRLVTGWRVCIDYRKLNEATRKDHFPLPFMDQMLERLTGNQYYCFFDGFSGISKFPSIQKIRRKPHSPAHTERLLTTAYLLGYAMHQEHFKEKMLKRCEDTNLCLNWEKSHFMVKEGIVLGHKISKEGIEVDKAKVDVITKLPHPTTIKALLSVQSWGNVKKNISGQYTMPALKHANFDLQTAGDHKKVQLNELNELRGQAYENSLIYKEKTKRLHDSKIKDNVFNIGDRFLLFNSRLKIFSGKLKSRWSGTFTISHVFPYGTVELSQPDGPNFRVNGHRLKHYFGEDVPKMVIPDLQTFPKDH